MNKFHYADETVDYPEVLAGEEILPVGTFWSYVSSHFLNGLLLYVEPMACWVLNRYQPMSEPYADTVSARTIEGTKFFFNKQEAINYVSTYPSHFSHTKLNIFEDDLILLAKVKDHQYILFWFDQDVSDCCVIRFNTEDVFEEICGHIEDWMNSMVFAGEETTYKQLPVNWIRGVPHW